MGKWSTQFHTQSCPCSWQGTPVTRRCLQTPPQRLSSNLGQTAWGYPVPSTVTASYVQCNFLHYSVAGLLLVEPEAALDREVQSYRGAAFALSTQRSYSTHRKRYLEFCLQFGYQPIPVSQTVLQRYVAHLAREIEYSSIRQYLNIIRLLHVEEGLPKPLEDNQPLSLMMRGVRRTLGDATSRKLPITPQILLKTRGLLNWEEPGHILFWAAALAAFFGMLRQSNLLPNPPFDPTKHLRRCDVLAYPWGLGLSIRWSKTIQFRERELLVPLPHLPGHPLDPVSAVHAAFKLHTLASSEAPVFFDPKGKGPFTPTAFAKMLQSLLRKLDLDSKAFSGHSLRRGGATWALHNKLPAEAIKVLGDWRSDAYLAYVEIPLLSRVNLVSKLAATLPTTP